MKINLKFPIVLCHGFIALGNFSWQRTKFFGYFKKIRQILEPLDIKIYEPLVAASDRAERRAEELNNFLKNEVSEEKVHLICHSMGGLDGRLLASHLNQKGKIFSLTTVSTPHHGTPFADWCVDKIYTPKVNHFLNLLGMTLEGLYDLTTEGAEKFNDNTPDNPNVKYLSFSTMQKISRTTPFLIFPHKIITRLLPENPQNDGLVPEISARWSGFVETIKADHLGVLGYITMPRAKEDFDPESFYTNLANKLYEMEKI